MSDAKDTASVIHAEETPAGSYDPASVEPWKREPGIVLVEDSLADAALIRELLKDEWTASLEIRHFSRVTPAAEWLSEHGAGCVLLDLSLPDSRRLEGLVRVARDAPTVPIVVLTGFDDEPTAVDALKAGAQDYLAKNYIDSRLLARTVRYAIERNKTDIRLQANAYHDPLTGVADRKLFEERLDRAHLRFQRTAEPYALMFIDIDKFKQVNDTYGHAAGDAVLTAVSQRIDGLLRGDDTLARFGGDEFVVLCQGVNAKEDAVHVADRIWHTVTATPVAIEGESIPIELSIGIAIAQKPTLPPEKLLREADAAMYEAKAHSERYELAHD